MNNTKKIILIVGLAWCATCALFPPRQYSDAVRDSQITPPREFVLDRDYEKFFFKAEDAKRRMGAFYSVDVNGGRLLAELVLIAAITGVAFLLQDEIAKGLQKLSREAQPGASPNGGPAERFGNSGVGGGPPSVS